MILVFILVVVLHCSGLVHNSPVTHWRNIFIKLEMVYNKTSAKCTIDLAFEEVKTSQDVLSVTTESEEEAILKMKNMRECNENKIRMNGIARSWFTWNLIYEFSIKLCDFSCTIMHICVPVTPAHMVWFFSIQYGLTQNNKWTKVLTFSMVTCV